MGLERRNLDDVYYNGKSLIDFYTKHPSIAAYDLLNVDLAPMQRIVFDDMWFKNYVITVAGRGVGKSASIDSLSFTPDQGLCYLNEIFPPIPSFLNSGETLEISDGNKLLTSVGFRPVKRVSLEKYVEGKVLKTVYGYTHKGTSHHPLLTVDEECNLYYKKLEDFSPDDYICIERDINKFGGNKIDKDDSYLIGLFMGDGCIVDGYNHVSITTADLEIKDFCESYCKSNNISHRIDEDKRSEGLNKIIFKQFDYFFDKYDIERTYSYDKCVPKSIRSGNFDAQISFLSGLFDSDGSFNGVCVDLSSTSYKFVNEVQMMLLNLGIVSRVREKKTKSDYGSVFVLEVSSINLKIFMDVVGFRLTRKQKALESFLIDRVFNPNLDVVPGAKGLCTAIAKSYRRNNAKSYNDNHTPSLRYYSSNSKEYTYSKLRVFLDNVDQLLDKGYYFDPDSKDKIAKLKYLLYKDFYFDRVKSVEDWHGDCYDFEMDMPDDLVEPNYFCNGFINHNTFLLGLLSALSCMLYPGYRVGLIAPVFRQSKMIFAEVEKLYSRSSLLREACEKRPTRGSDTCYLKFKAVGGSSGSYIEALPLGDGSKIRGSRFYLIVIDELAQVPDKVLDMVVRPMAATTLEPMENVRRIERQKELIRSGRFTEDDFEEETVNKMIMASSGYYKFNHMWRRMKDYWGQMDKHGDRSSYMVHQVPYWDMPEGFLDMNNIEEAKRIMSEGEFRMEYEAAMISDSEGFFKASLLEACTINSGFSLELKGRAGEQYILGVDPNQGGNASCGIVVIKLGQINKIVNVFELKKKTTQDLTKAVQGLCDQYNVMRIFMDKGGGGKAVCDLLEEGYDGYEPIIDTTNKDNEFKEGRHILELVNFNPAWISDANFTTKALLENKTLRFPEPPVSTLDLEGLAYERLNTMKSQMLNIVVSQTPSGLLHFDTPKKGQNKDLYSALILAAHGIRLFEKMHADTVEIQMCNSGLIREHKPGARFATAGGRPGNSGSANPMQAALLTPRKKRRK